MEPKIEVGNTYECRGRDWRTRFTVRATDKSTATIVDVSTGYFARISLRDFHRLLRTGKITFVHRADGR
jgi:hypothetical protein